MKTHKELPHTTLILLLLCLTVIFSCKAEKEGEENPLTPVVDLVLEKSSVALMTGDEKQP